jgi:homoserine dehydrogenase
VVSDVIDIARNVLSGAPVRISMSFYNHEREIPLQSFEDVTTRYYLRFTVIEKPKVLAPLAGILGDHGISIASVVQKESPSAERVCVIILTHPARENNLQSAVKEIERLDVVKEKTQIIRIEE